MFDQPEFDIVSLRYGEVETDELYLIAVNSDPRIGLGLQAEPGSRAFHADGREFYKFGAGDLDWRLTPIYGNNFQFVQSLTEVNTTSTPSTSNNILIGTFPEQYLTITTPADLPLGTYEISISYVWSGNSTTQDFCCRLNRDNGTELIPIQRQEPKDSAGNTPDAPPGAGTNQRHPATFNWIFQNLPAGVHTFDLEFASGAAGTIVTMIQASITFKRVS